MNLDLPPTTIVVVGGAALSLVATWLRFGWRITQLEKEVAKFEALQVKVTEMDGTTRESAKEQGRRLGTVEKITVSLEGRFDEFKAGFTTGRRSRTSAHGNAIPGKTP